MVRFRSALYIGAIPLFSTILALGQGTQSSPVAPGDEKQAISNEEIDLLRRDIRSQRKQIIAQNLSLTDSEAQRFWPVYDRCTSDLIKINDTKYKLIQSYMQDRNQMTEEQAKSWIDQWLQVDADTAALRQKYAPEFRRVLPARKAVLFEQLDRRTQLMIDIQLSSQIPLMQAGH